MTALEFGHGVFPSLERRGGCGINKKARSHRSAADGVVAHKRSMRMHFERSSLDDHPGCANKERDNFMSGAATPPFQGGEFRVQRSRQMSKLQTRAKARDYGHAET